jgi:hypothetical protein
VARTLSRVATSIRLAAVRQVAAGPIRLPAGVRPEGGARRISSASSLKNALVINVQKTAPVRARSLASARPSFIGPRSGRSSSLHGYRHLLRIFFRVTWFAAIPVGVLAYITMTILRATDLSST